MSFWSRAVSFWNRHWWTKVLFLAALLLVLVWRADPAAIADSFLHVDVRWLLAAAAVDLFAIFLKGVNLKIVFDALGAARARVMEAFSATSIGLMVNWLVPARLGEVARAYALHISLRRRGVFMPVATIFGTVLGERLFAIAAIVALAALLLIGVSAPAWARTTLIVGGVVVGVIIVALVLYERWRKKSIAERQHVEFTVAGHRLRVPTLHAHTRGMHWHVPHLHAPRCRGCATACDCRLSVTSWRWVRASGSWASPERPCSSSPPSSSPGSCSSSSTTWSCSPST